MNNIMNWLKKTNVTYFLVSLLISLGAFLVNNNFRETFPRKLSESIFWLTIPIFVFSVINFFLKKIDILSSWVRFTNYYFIIALIIILLTPTSTHGLDFVPFVKETVTIALASTYSIISLFLIIYKSLKKE